MAPQQQEGNKDKKYQMEESQLKIRPRGVDRYKIVWLWLEGVAATDIAQETKASLSTVYRWIRHWEKEGTLAPLKRRMGRQLFKRASRITQRASFFKPVFPRPPASTENATSPTFHCSHPLIPSPVLKPLTKLRRYRHREAVQHASQNLLASYSMNLHRELHPYSHLQAPTNPQVPPQFLFLPAPLPRPANWSDLLQDTKSSNHANPSAKFTPPPSQIPYKL